HARPGGGSSRHGPPLEARGQMGRPSVPCRRSARQGHGRPTRIMRPMSEPGASLEEAVRTLLAEIGEEPSREGLARTPQRVRRMYDELTAGYHVDPDALINGACFSVDYDEMVVVRDIEFFSLCEHHLLPFIGKAHIGYLPKGRVVGLSKIPRIVDMYAQRLQVQERLTVQVADFLMEKLEPKGVGCVIEATHLCTMMRGVKK